jgi:SprT-like family
VLLEFPIERESSSESRERRAAERTHPDDEAMVERLRSTHALLNLERFAGELSAVPIRVSRRMKSRLGHYTHRDSAGVGAEIVISRRHIRRHGWHEAVETLIHEMVHQWQDESGVPVDHGRSFKAKARAVGITAKARRDVA